MDERKTAGPLLDIVTNRPKVIRNRGRRFLVEDATDGPNRIRLSLTHDDRAGTLLTIEETYVIDCRNRAAVEHVMKEIRRLMEELDGYKLPE